ncbi:SOS response-associated peptidase [Williamsia sp. CHRR-6]|uniref:SOS response-associated peptidase n=1 Tax=Williamsia sp. CHRR-6 TaxID=2835871 RepID=UPI001BD9ADBF|nr:SOS response-associated peptidase [Williamsia sp. CHRR-6]MBT0565671.1 SOS response-associated peptidase [Williamsia sp. CHRR-6]
MCGRYAVTTDPALLAAELDAVDEVTVLDDTAPPDSSSRTPGPNYNVAPTTTVMTVVRRHGRDTPDDDPTMRVRAMRWGLVPPWTKELARAPLLFNARAESAAEKSSFKSSLKSRRCLVPMDGWYEWRKDVGIDGKPLKRPFFMSPTDGTRLFMAGLWAVWHDRSAADHDQPLLSCTILTTDSVGALTDIHDRMPLIMPTERWEEWLDPDAPAPAELLAPPTPDLVSAIAIREVAPLVNRVSNNGPELLAPVDPEPEQGTLL